MRARGRDPKWARMGRTQAEEPSRLLSFADPQNIFRTRHGSEVKRDLVDILAVIAGNILF